MSELWPQAEARDMELATTRREAMPKGAATATSKAAIGYEYCGKLFALEKKFSEMSDDVRKTARQVKTEPLLEAYWLWLKTLDPVPGSKPAEAVSYAQNQKPYLSAFLDHGEVDISNNFAENAIRPFVIGRKNWLFSIPRKARNPAPLFTHWWKRPKLMGWIRICISSGSWRSFPTRAIIPAKLIWIFSCRGSLPSKPPVPLLYLLNPPGVSDEIPPASFLWVIVKRLPWD